MQQRGHFTSTASRKIGRVDIITTICIALLFTDGESGSQRGASHMRFRPSEGKCLKSCREGNLGQENCRAKTRTSFPLEVHE